MYGPISQYLERARLMQWEQYGIFFASAGHASLIDYPEAKGLQRIASKMNTDGAIISAVYGLLCALSK
jgi:hypothetical protein